MILSHKTNSQYKDVELKSQKRANWKLKQYLCYKSSVLTNI